jgi:hypothetical protein
MQGQGTVCVCVCFCVCGIYLSVRVCLSVRVRNQYGTTVTTPHTNTTPTYSSPFSSIAETLLPLLSVRCVTAT